MLLKVFFFKKKNKHDKNSLDASLLVTGIFFYDSTHLWFWTGYTHLRNWTEYNTILDRNVPNKKGKSGKYMCIYKYQSEIFISKFKNSSNKIYMWSNVLFFVHHLVAFILKSFRLKNIICSSNNIYHKSFGEMYLWSPILAYKSAFVETNAPRSRPIDEAYISKASYTPFLCSIALLF